MNACLERSLHLAACDPLRRLLLRRLECQEQKRFEAALAERPAAFVSSGHVVPASAWFHSAVCGCWRLVSASSREPCAEHSCRSWLSFFGSRRGREHPPATAAANPHES